MVRAFRVGILPLVSIATVASSRDAGIRMPRRDDGASNVTLDAPIDDDDDDDDNNNCTGHNCVADCGGGALVACPRFEAETGCDCAVCECSLWSRRELIAVSEFSVFWDAIFSSDPGTSTSVEVSADIPFEDMIVIGENRSVTIRSSDGIVAYLDGQNRTRLFAIFADADLRLENVGLVNGFAEYGGGAIFSYGTVRLTGCVAYNNTATENGGVIYNFEGMLSIDGGDFGYNFAASDGGVVYSYNSSSTTISNAEFRNNSANGFGGVISIKYSHDAAIKSCNFRSNTAYAGGVHFSSWSNRTSIESSYFFGNSAATSGGAVVSSESPSMFISNSTFLRHLSIFNGGVVYNYYSHNMTISGGNFSENAANSSGGVIFNYNSDSMTSEFGSFTLNAAGVSGGVVYNYFSDSMATHFGSFTLNTALGGGGVIFNENSDSMTSDFGSFTLNAAGVNGGVVYNYFSDSMTCDFGFFTLNTAGKAGGAVFNWYSVGTRITSGYFSENDSSQGGAIFNEWSDRTLVGSSTFINNTALESAGAISFWGTNIEETGTVANSTFVGNSAPYGGAIYQFDKGDGLLIRSGHFSFNSASSQGGVLWLSAETQIIDGVFEHNHAPRGGFAHASADANLGLLNVTARDNLADFGGCLYSEGARLAVARVLVTRNTAEFMGDAQSGVAFFAGNTYLYGSSTVIFSNNSAFYGATLALGEKVSCIVSGLSLLDNQALFRGAIYLANQASLAATEIVARNNWAANLGGVLYAAADSVCTVRSSNFTENFAEMGGVMYIESSTATIANVQLVENRADVDGGGAYLDGGAYATFERVVLFRNNARVSGGAVFVVESTLECESTRFVSNTALTNGGAVFAAGNGSLFKCDGDCSYDSNTAGENGGVCALEDGGVAHFHPLDVGINNSAPDGAGGVAYYDHRTTRRPTIPDGIFGTASYGDLVASGIARLTMVHSGSPEASGLELQSAINVTVVDDLEQICNAKTTSIVVDLETPTQNTFLDGSTTLYLHEGVASTSGGFRVTSAPDTNVTVLGVLREFDLNASIFIRLRACEIGEVPTNLQCTVCDGANVFSVDPKSDQDCRDCPSHASCTSDADDEHPGAVVVLDAGYWRSGARSRNVRACPFVDACKPDVDLWVEKDSCASRHRGPLCARCKRGYHLDRQSGECIPCSKAVKRETLISLVSVFASVIVGAAAYSAFKLCFPSRLAPLIKILYIFWQVVTSEYSSFLFVAYPQRYGGVARHLGVVLNLNLYSLMARFCRSVNHYDELVISTASPLVGLALIAAGYGLASSERHKNWASLAALVLLYVVYTAVSSVIFKTYSCDPEFGRGDGEPEDSAYRGKSFLKADYSLTCEGSKHATFLVYATLMMVVYVFGTPALFFCLLWRKRALINPEPRKLAQRVLAAAAAADVKKSQIARGDDDDIRHSDAEGDGDVANGERDDDDDDDDAILLRKYAASYAAYADHLETCPSFENECVRPAIGRLGTHLVLAQNRSAKEAAHLSFLYADYDPRYWWFESFECLRRLLLTSVLPAVISSENHLALLYGTFIIALIFFVVYLVTRPFAIRDINAFAILMAGTLSMMLLLTIILYVEDNMDREFRAGWDRAVIAFALICFSVILGPASLLFYARLEADVDVKQYVSSVSTGLWSTLNYGRRNASFDEVELDIKGLSSETSLETLPSSSTSSEHEFAAAKGQPMELTTLNSDASSFELDALVYPD